MVRSSNDAKELKLKANHNWLYVGLGRCYDAKELKLKANHNKNLRGYSDPNDAKELKLIANHNLLGERQYVPPMQKN